MFRALSTTSESKMCARNYRRSGHGPGGGTNSGVSLAAYGNEGTWGSGITTGSTGTIYGNARILPLVGGSGGGGGGSEGASGWHTGGGAGGGAILIAAGDTLTIDGLISANGGAGISFGSGVVPNASGSGSGGAIRLVADIVTGNGQIEALGGLYTYSGTTLLQSGGDGRLRIEANSVGGSLGSFPQINVVAPDSPVVIWPPAEAPDIRVISVGSEIAPSDPSSELGIGQTDISLDNTTSSDVLLETSNVDLAANVTIRVVPKFGAPFVVQAINVSGTPVLATWQATITPPDGFFAIQARAVNP